ncbi:MAG: lipopolysaccharide biosynthesis protein [Bacteroides sp.]|nr:lipopolysaccharide biosynthesis protein [Bacteroides sp.]
MANLKLTTARTLKWNAIDRISSQLIYAVVGVVLANILSREEFGLVGALAIFQSFATIFIDSGFGAALLREKHTPSQTDYSTVFWFNTGVSLTVYAALFIAAPGIAMMFDKSEALIPMSRVMFLTFVINGLAIVQTNRLMKRMEVKMIAVSNTVALIVSGAVGVWLAIRGYGAWAMVWYSVVMAAVKALILWGTGHWMPALTFSIATLRKIHRVGASVFSSALLNTISLNIYNFVIGVFYSISDLGLYNQADKWSKMGYTSISQTLTSSFVPMLSEAQDSPSDFVRYVTKTTRFTAFILFPAMTGMALVATPLFHLLFAHKWDDAIPLFRILAIRGIFIVLISLYSNYLLALGKARALFASEIIKDALIFVAILTTIFSRSITTLILGQMAAALLTWLILLPLTSRSLRHHFSAPRPTQAASSPSTSDSTSAQPGTAIPHSTASRSESATANFDSTTTDSATAQPGTAIPSTVSILTLLRPILPFVALTASAAGGAYLLNPLFATVTAGLSLFLASLIRLLLLSLTALLLYLLLLRLFRVPELPEALSYLLGRFRRR